MSVEDHYGALFNFFPLPLIPSLLNFFPGCWSPHRNCVLATEMTLKFLVILFSLQQLTNLPRYMVLFRNNNKKGEWNWTRWIFFDAGALLADETLFILVLRRFDSFSWWLIIIIKKNDWKMSKNLVCQFM